MPVIYEEDRKKYFKEVHERLSYDESIKEGRRFLTCRISAMRY